jgi:hypothetical protein
VSTPWYLEVMEMDISWIQKMDPKNGKWIQKMDPFGLSGDFVDFKNFLVVFR